MSKKITLLILLTLLFTAFSSVKAEESLPNLTPTALKARIGLYGTDYNLNDTSKSFDVGDSLNITGNYQNLGGSYTVPDPANPFLSNLKITKNGKTFLDSTQSSNSGATAGFWVWTPTEAGTYTVVLTLDKNNAISESNETDNTLEKTITITASSAQPSITSIFPNSASVGSSVTINGSNFNLQLPNRVMFSDSHYVNGVPGITYIAGVTSSDGSKVTFIVPSISAIDGWVSVVNVVNQQSNSVPFTITASSAQPSNSKITSISPESGQKGTTLTINGEGFKDDCSGKGTRTCQAGISFGNYYLGSENFISYDVIWTNNKITVKVPESANTGNIKIYRNEIFNWGETNAYNDKIDIIGPVFTVSGTSVTPDTQISEINTNANLLINDKMSEILAELNQLRSIINEQQTQIKYLSSLLKDVQGISAASQAVLNNFITYGVDANTVKLGAGERAAVINSYKFAFDKLPTTEAELADVIKIANGRWPSITNKDAENKAKSQFQKIYKRIADMNNASDNAAVTVMAYGLRQKAENRNLNSEVNGIKIFKAIYGHTPNSTEDWNIMQAITYSGASR